jgi:hypothetical protein
MFEVSTEYREPLEDQRTLPEAHSADGLDADFLFSPDAQSEERVDGEPGALEDEVAAMMEALMRPIGETANSEEVVVLFEGSSTDAEAQAPPVEEARHRVGRSRPVADSGASMSTAEGRDTSAVPNDGRSAGGGGKGPTDDPPIPPTGGGETGGPDEERDPAQAEREARRLRILEGGGEANAAGTQSTDIVIDLIHSSIDTSVDKHVVATGSGPGTFAEARYALERLRDLSPSDASTVRSEIIALCNPAIDPETGQEIVGSRILEAARLRLLDSSRQDATLARVMSQPRFRGARTYTEEAITGWNASRSATVDAAEEIIDACNELRLIASDPRRLGAHRESIAGVLDRIDKAEGHIRLAIEESGRARTSARRSTIVFGPPSDTNRPGKMEPDFSRPASEWE